MWGWVRAEIQAGLRRGQALPMGEVRVVEPLDRQGWVRKGKAHNSLNWEVCYKEL